MDKDISQFQLFTGYLSGVMNSIFYGLGSAASQALEGAVPDCQLSVARFVSQFLVYIIMAKLTGTSMYLSKQHIPYMLYSSILSLVYTIGFFGATGHIPLVEAVSFEIIFTIISAMVQAKLLFHRGITPLNIISFCICTIGLMLATQPSWLFKQDIQFATVTNSSFDASEASLSSTKNPQSSLKEDESSNMVIVYTLLILSGIADGMYFDVNAILLHEVPPIIKATYVSGFGLLTSIVLAFYLEDFVIELTVKQFLLVLGHSTASAVAFFTTMYACQIIGGIRASLVFSLQIVVMLVLQYSLMKSIMPGHQNWVEVLGAGIILFGVVLQPANDVIQNNHQANSLP